MGEKGIIAGELCDEDLTPEETCLLVLSLLYFSGDFTLRTFGSWCPGNEDGNEEYAKGMRRSTQCAELVRGIAVSAMYNFFRGFRFLAWFLRHVWYEGIRLNPALRQNLDVVNTHLEPFIAQVITNIELRDPLMQTEIEIMNHSRYVRFVSAITGVFEDAFRKYHDTDFKNVDLKRFFIGCVLQPLSLQQTNRIFGDPLSLNAVDHEVFGVLRSIVQLIRAGFTGDIPGAALLFRHRKFQQKYLYKLILINYLLKFKLINIKNYNN